MIESEETMIPCFLCGNPAELKQSKNQKPYFICEGCGVQAFIRGAKGIKRLQEAMRSKTFNHMATKSTALINQMIRLKEKIEEIQKRQGPLSLLIEDKELSLAQKALEKEMDKIKSQLNQISGDH